MLLHLSAHTVSIIWLVWGIRSKEKGRYWILSICESMRLFDQSAKAGKALDKIQTLLSITTFQLRFIVVTYLFPEVHSGSVPDTVTF